MWGRDPKNNSVLKLWSVISHQPWYLPWSTKGTYWSMLWKRRQLLHPCNKVCFGVNLLEGSFLKPQAAAWHLWPQSFKLTQNRVFKRWISFSLPATITFGQAQIPARLGCRMSQSPPWHQPHPRSFSWTQLEAWSTRAPSPSAPGWASTLPPGLLV